MANHRGQSRGRVACPRCRRIVDPSIPDETLVLLDVVRVTDTISHALETAWLAREGSPEWEARLQKLQQMVNGMLTPAQRTALLSVVNYLDNALAQGRSDNSESA